MRFSSKPAIFSSTGGWGMYYYGYRFYDPATQRWLNRDPIGEVDGVSLYAFVRNLPLFWVDPLGLKIEYGDDPAGKGAKMVIECWKKTLPQEASLRKLISQIERASGVLTIKSMDDRKTINGNPIAAPETVFNEVTKNSTMYINQQPYKYRGDDNPGDVLYRYPEALAHELLHAAFQLARGKPSEGHSTLFWEEEKGLRGEARSYVCP
jgi:RHS repeat-associated protein